MQDKGVQGCALWSYMILFCSVNVIVFFLTVIFCFFPPVINGLRFIDQLSFTVEEKISDWATDEAGRESKVGTRDVKNIWETYNKVLAVVHMYGLVWG